MSGLCRCQPKRSLGSVFYTVIFLFGFTEDNELWSSNRVTSYDDLENR